MKVNRLIGFKKKAIDFIHRSNIVYILLFYIVLILSGALLGGCSDVCETEHKYTYYKPIYTSLEELRSAVAREQSRSITQLGKIYYKSGYLYLNEPGLGLHVIDNRDPSQPERISFVNIPGNRSLSAKGNYLYVDSYVDLVVLDISDPVQIAEVARVENVFTDYNSYGYYIDPELGLVTGWEEVSQVDITASDCNKLEYNATPFGGLYYEDGIALASAEVGTSRAIADKGIGGSMATFTIYDDYLYALENNSDLITINITDLSAPLVHAKQNIGWGVETLFPFEDKLFMGANDGMYIYDVVQPSNPSLITKYEHINSCDPVVVQGDYAYVTLRSGTTCQGFTNQLEVINISDIAHPKLEYTYPMFNPHGLGIDNEALFVCDGTAGLKVYDASDISKIGESLKVQYGNINALDVIPLHEVLMMIGGDGLYQYDYADLDNITLISKIKITPED